MVMRLESYRICFWCIIHNDFVDKANFKKQAYTGLQPVYTCSLLCCTVLLCLPCHLYHALYALCSFMEHVFSIVNSNESTTKFTIALLDSRGFV